MCPPLSDNCCSKREHALVNPVFGRTRNVGGTLAAAAESVDATVVDFPSQCVGDSFRWPPLHPKAVVVKGADQLGDGRRTVRGQVHGEHIAQFDPAKATLIHRRNIAHSYDTGAVVAVRRHNGCRRTEWRV
jgi:hypothetical protein